MTNRLFTDAELTEHMARWEARDPEGYRRARAATREILDGRRDLWSPSRPSKAKRAQARDAEDKVVAQAEREVAQGRHPDEAWGDAAGRVEAIQEAAAYETEMEEEAARDRARDVESGIAAGEVLDVRQVSILREALGRKFEAQDVTEDLRRTAYAYLATWSADGGRCDEFLAAMKAKLTRYGSLFDGPVKGILNCMATAIRPGRRSEPETVEAIAREERRQDAEPWAGPARSFSKIEKDGMYLHDGSIVKVQVAVHGSGNLYAKVLVVDAFGSAHFEYAKGLVNRLDPAERMTLEQAQHYGKLYGVCIRCGATLTDEVSIDRAMGPVCAGKF